MREGTRCFLIPPSDLQDRRKRCRPEVQKLLRFKWETITSCNVCSSRRSAIISTADRYGLPEQTALCLDCGLFYLTQRFAAEAYSRFYSNGSFRNISSRFNKVTHTIERIRAEQVDYARTLSSVLGAFVSSGCKTKLLDVGGSVGLVTSEFVNRFGMSGTVLDPAEEEVAAARGRGLDAVVGTIEKYDTDERYDLILLCRSVEHLTDLREGFARMRNLLKPGGLLYCDIADFMELCCQVGPPQTITKIDHCYWLTRSTALDIFRALGFELVSMNIVFGFGYAGYLLRSCEPQMMGSVPEERIQTLIERIHQTEFEWSTDTSRTIWQSLRFKAYRMKRMGLRLTATNGDGRRVNRQPAVGERLSVPTSVPAALPITDLNPVVRSEPSADSIASAAPDQLVEKIRASVVATPQSSLAPTTIHLKNSC